MRTRALYFARARMKLWVLLLGLPFALASACSFDWSRGPAATASDGGADGADAETRDVAGDEFDFERYPDGAFTDYGCARLQDAVREAKYWAKSCVDVSNV